MLPSFSLFSSIPFIILLLLFLFLITHVIAPKLRLQTYKQEGIMTYFFPIVGMLHYLRINFKKYGDVMADAKHLTKQHPPYRLIVSNLSNKLFFILRDPKYIKDFLQNPSLYKKGPMLDWSKNFTPYGLVTSEGELWKRHRRIISASFHYEFLKANLNRIQDTTREFLDKVPREGCKDFPIINKIQEITGEVVGRIFFGENLNSYTLDGRQLTLALADIVCELSMSNKNPLILLFGIRMLKFPLIPKFRRLTASMAKIRQLCFKIVADRKAKPEQGNDLLGALLATQKSDDLEKRFSDEEIIDEFLTFFVAGMDTTGHLIGMTLYNLTQYPQYLKDLKEERDKLYNTDNGSLSDNLQKMDILHSLLKETMRFHSPAPFIFARVANVDHKIQDIQIKKGDLVIPELIAPAFDEKYIEDPTKFSPERWRNADTSKIDPFAFIPFSAGPRNCIGQHLAIIESKIIISEFLNRFDFKLKEGYELKLTFKFLYGPETELLLDLYQKSSE